ARVGSQARPVRVHPDDRPVEAGRVAPRADVLAAERAALRARRGLRSPNPGRRIAAGVPGLSPLPVVDEAVARAVAAAGVERPAAREDEVADRVALVLGAPVVDQHVLASDHRVAGAVQAREPGADDAAVSAVAGGIRAVVVGA